MQKLRLGKGWTTPELAEKVGVTDASITQTEAGQTLPRKPTVKSYEVALSASLMPIWEQDMARRKPAQPAHAPAARATKTPKTRRTLKPETFDNLARLGTSGKTTPEAAEKLVRRVKKREPEIVKEIERRERAAKRKDKGRGKKQGGKKK